MERRFTLEYWLDDKWYVGRLKEVPGVFSQGATLKELERNIEEAYQLMMADERIPTQMKTHEKELAIKVWKGKSLLTNYQKAGVI